MAYVLRPEPNEYPAYFHNSIQSVPEGDLIELLGQNLKRLLDITQSVSEEKSTFRYAEGKWSIREVIGHLTDTERVFVYRAFRFSRKDKTDLSGFDQDLYITNSNYQSQSLSDLVSEFTSVRQSSILFFKSLTNNMWHEKGTANKTSVSVRALACMCYAHVDHHLTILTERYLK